jgi:hypothetical protein
LPVQFSASDFHIEHFVTRFGLEADLSGAKMKGNTGLFECFQPWCTSDELDELWCVEYDVIEKGYIQVVESRGIDASHEVVQVFADPLEPQ